VTVEEHPAHESTGVDQAVGDDEAEQATLALEEAPEEQPHDGIAKKPAKALIQVV
jgi:hypothetical protein